MRVNKGNKRPKDATVKHTNIKRVVVALLLATAGLVVFTLAAEHTYQEKQRQQLNQTLQEKVELQKVLERNKLDSEKNQQEIERLKKELQAKKDGQARVLAESARVTPVQPRVAVSGSCAEWIAAAGITDVQNAAELIRRESGCNPNAINRSSGACGVAQELPCGKSGCALGDGACQVRWMNRYVLGRYGSWANAVAHHNSHNWY